MNNLLKNYTVRTLTNEDEINLQNGGEIYAKKQINDNSTIINAFEKVTPHVLCGSKSNTAMNSCWISHSKDLIKNFKLFGMSSNGFLRKRNKVALIKNNNYTILMSKREIDFETLDEFYDIKISEMDKIVLDISSDQNIEYLDRLNLLVNKDGEKFDYSSRFQGYAKKSAEVLSLNKILKQDIECILNLLEIDVIYAFSYSNYFEDLESIVLSVIEQRENIENYLNKSSLLHINFYQKYYVERINIYDMVKIICENDNLDPLIINYSIMNVKREFLRNLIKQIFGYDIKNIKIIEEERKVCRMGNNNFNNYEYFNFYGEMVPYNKIRCSQFDVCDCSPDDITLLFKYEPIDYLSGNIYLEHEQKIMKFYQKNILLKNTIEMK